VLISAEFVREVGSNTVSHLTCSIHCALHHFLLSLFLILASFYLLTVRIGGYCFTWSHSMTHTHTLGRTALDGKKQHSQQTTTMPPFEHAIPASEQPQTYALDRAATGIEPVTTYLLTYLLTPWSRVLLEKLTSKLCR